MGSDQMEAALAIPLRTAHRPVTEQAVVGVAPLGQVGAGTRVGRGGAGRGWGREQLHYPQGPVRAAVDGVMPGVAPEEHGLAGAGHLDLTGLRVGQHHLALHDVQDLVGSEDGPVGVGVGEAGPGR